MTRINYMSIVVAFFLSFLSLSLIFPQQAFAADRKQFSYFSNPYYFKENFKEEFWTGNIIIKFKEETELELDYQPKIMNSERDRQLVENFWQKWRLAKPERIFKKDVEKLKSLQERLSLKTKKKLPDLSLYIRVSIKKEEVFDILDEISQFDFIEAAYPEMKPVPSSDTPDFSYKQVYLSDYYDGGLDVEYAWQFPGGDGSNVTVEDLEVDDFNYNHEDLDIVKDEINCLGVGVDAHHGTCAAGIVAAKKNNYGVTGIAYGTEFKACPLGEYQEIIDVAESLSPGDIILLEYQAFSYEPIEIYQHYFDAISYATSMGIIVIEPAGNGEKDLDDSVYDGIFDRNIRDSGAIMIGGGSPYNYDRWYSVVGSSNYGSRLDIQAWAEDVTTTDVRSVLYGNNPNNSYTDSFSGTSAASAMAAGVTAVLQSIHKTHFGIPLSPEEMRNLLDSTGLPERLYLGRIGPQPNLRNALVDLGIGQPRPPFPEGPANPKAGKAVCFGGSPEVKQKGYIKIPEAGNVDSGDWTVEFWGRLNYHSDMYKSLYCSKGQPPPEGELVGKAVFNLHFPFPEVGEPLPVRFSFYSLNDPNSSVSFESSEKISLREWKHLALVKKGDLFSIFIDGKKSSTAEYQMNESIEGPMSLGVYVYDNSTFGRIFPGCLDEFRVSKIARYENDFTLNSELFINDSDTKVLYHFDQADDNFVPDSSGNEYNGEVIKEVSYIQSTIPALCPHDYDGDNLVKIKDLLYVLQNWGSGFGVLQLIGVLINWGECSNV